MKSNAISGKGVVITEGVKPWQILQQNSRGTAQVRLSGTYYCVRQSEELPMSFQRMPSEDVNVWARIVTESGSQDVCPWQSCLLIGENQWQTVFEDVPAGGLYRVETRMEYSGWDGLSSTRGDMIHCFGVGDVFVVAGQSNAAGRSLIPLEDAPELGVHVLRASGEWSLGTHPLGETTNAVHVGHFENHNPGHTPWLAFAKRLKHALGYPIGLVMSAYGGSPLRWWNPEENGALLYNMLEQLADYELSPRAVLWFQGETDACDGTVADYAERFRHFVQAVRSRLDPQLPFLTVQLNRCTKPSSIQMDRQWGMVRQAQSDAAQEIPGVYLIPSADLSLFDFVHLSSQANLMVAQRCADCALAELYGKPCAWKAPEVSSAVQPDGKKIRVEFRNVLHSLHFFEVPPELLPIEAEDSEGIQRCVGYTAEKNAVVLEFNREVKPGAVLHGMWRMNPGGSVPCDFTRMPVLSFYGLPVHPVKNGGKT